MTFLDFFKSAEQKTKEVAVKKAQEAAVKKVQEDAEDKKNNDDAEIWFDELYEQQKQQRQQQTGYDPTYIYLQNEVNSPVPNNGPDYYYGDSYSFIGENVVKINYYDSSKRTQDYLNSIHELYKRMRGIYKDPKVSYYPESFYSNYFKIDNFNNTAAGQEEIKDNKTKADAVNVAKAEARNQENINTMGGREEKLKLKLKDGKV